MTRQGKVYQTSTACQPPKPASGAFRLGLLPLRHIPFRDSRDIP
jgi:hypothetical protein